jgi:ketosteroid isomerase-like protein
MKWIVRCVCVALLAGLLWWGWRTFFPSDERRIQKLLNGIAQTVSVPMEGKFIGGVLAADRLKGYFTPEVEVAVDVPGETRFNLTGREELAQAYIVARAHYRGLAVEFFDMQVAVAPDHASAVADLTARARQATGEMHVQEMRLNLVRRDGEWRVQRVETTRSIKF